MPRLVGALGLLTFLCRLSPSGLSSDQGGRPGNEDTVSCFPQSQISLQTRPQKARVQLFGSASGFVETVCTFKTL